MVDTAAIAQAFTQPQPPFEVGQLWQYDARDTYRVVEVSDDGQVAMLHLVALAGRYQDSECVTVLDRRTCPIWTSWGQVEQVTLWTGEVLR